MSRLWIEKCLLIASMALMSSCMFGPRSSLVFDEGKRPGPFTDMNGRIVIPSGKAPGYNTLRKLVLEKSCISCHGKKGGVNLETYTATRNVMTEIGLSVLDEHSMPPKRIGPLSAGAQLLVRAWIDAGGPENDVIVGETQPTVSPSPSPVPSTTPVVTPTESQSPPTLKGAVE